MRTGRCRRWRRRSPRSRASESMSASANATSSDGSAARRYGASGIAQTSGQPTTGAPGGVIWSHDHCGRERDGAAGRQQPEPATRPFATSARRRTPQRRSSDPVSASREPVSAGVPDSRDRLACRGVVAERVAVQRGVHVRPGAPVGRGRTQRAPRAGSRAETPTSAPSTGHQASVRIARSLAPRERGRPATGRRAPAPIRRRAQLEPQRPRRRGAPRRAATSVA